MGAGGEGSKNKGQGGKCVEGNTGRLGKVNCWVGGKGNPVSVKFGPVAELTGTFDLWHLEPHVDVMPDGNAGLAARQAFYRKVTYGEINGESAFGPHIDRVLATPV